ncbi:MAG: class I mannose-6-phosphate isomerase [Myxococcota bacterium]|nr:class I mannose-6-phosphate isomerase [Myxococcota bacterium]
MTAPNNRLGPILLQPRLDSRLWGGDRLGPWMGLASAPSQLAEAWLVYEENQIRDGRFAGRTLGEVARELGPELVGGRSFQLSGAEFPLLAKLIDARERLSIQVHPDDAFAHQHEAATGFHGKTEAWYILGEDPDRDVFLGFERDVSEGEVRAGAADGTLERLLRRLPVSSGQTVFVPARTVHGINAGTLLFEIQQKSDLTYRLYDYGRRGPDGKLRPLHLEKGLAVAQLTPPPAQPVPSPGAARWSTVLVSCPFFALERWEVVGKIATATDPSSFEILVPITGPVELRSAAGRVTLGRGDAAVLPAALGDYELASGAPGQLLRAFVPTGG